MRVHRLDLQNFRQFEYLSIRFSAPLTVIVGANAGGKTSFLEALALFAFGRSIRAKKNIEIIHFGTTMAQARVDITHSGKTFELAMRVTDKGKQVNVNRIPQKTLTDLLGHLTAVVFTPDDLALIKDGPDERRRFIDLGVSQCDPKATVTLQRYNHLLKERNLLLKRRQIDALSIWDEELALAGAAVTRHRRQFIDALAPQAHIQYSELANDGQSLHIEHRPFSKRAADSDLESELHKMLRDATESDLIRGYTSVGPHREDLALSLGTSPAATYASQGQQRTVVLALKLTLVDHIFRETGEYPILLLDDVLSELDISRQTRLFQLVGKAQTFLTSTQAPSLPDTAKAQAEVFQLEHGIISK